MQLSGHQGDVLGGKFHPEGEVLVTAGMDRQICESVYIPISTEYVHHSSIDQSLTIQGKAVLYFHLEYHAVSYSQIFIASVTLLFYLPPSPLSLLEGVWGV